MAIPATNAKHEVAQLLAQLPDDSTLEDIQYHLYVLEKIKSGRSEVARGQVHTQDEARKRMGQWLDT